MFGGLAISDGGAVAPTGDRAHRARPARRGVRRRRVRTTRPAQRVGDQAASCSTRTSSPAWATSTPTRGCGWRRLHGERPGTRLRKSDVERVLSGCRQVMLEALGAGRDLVRRALRERQRRERLLRPVPEGLRAGGGALLPLRYADPPGALHEPLLVLLPGLPAGPSPPPAGRSPDSRADHPAAPRLQHPSPKDQPPRTQAPRTRPHEQGPKNKAPGIQAPDRRVAESAGTLHFCDGSAGSGCISVTGGRGPEGGAGGVSRCST